MKATRRFFFVVCLSWIATLSLTAAKAPTFQDVTIDDQIRIGYGLAIADVDGDGKDDILLADAHQIVWYRSPFWEKFVMTEKLTERDHVCIAAKDLDGDGKAEVAVGAQWNPGNTVDSGSVHYLIPPEDRTKQWDQVRLPNEPTTHRMHWAINWQGDQELVVLPLHGRGNQGGEGAGVKILAYRMPSNPRDEWETRVINDELHKTHNFDPIQWDEDQAVEFVLGGAEGVFVSNWMGDALGLIEIGDDAGGGAGEVRLGSGKNGQRFIATIEPMHGKSVVVYNESGSDWDRTVIDDTLLDGHAVACGDLAGIGRDQIVVGWRAGPNPNFPVGIKIYMPLDDRGTQWEATLVDDNGIACEDLKLADLNGDGRLDIIGCGRRSKNVKIYWNRGV